MHGRDRPNAGWPNNALAKGYPVTTIPDHAAVAKNISGAILKALKSSVFRFQGSAGFVGFFAGRDLVCDACAAFSDTFSDTRVAIPR